MRLVLNDTKETRFIRTWNDGAGVYARPISETEKNKIRVAIKKDLSGTYTNEVFDLQYRIRVLQTSLSGWDKFEDEDGNPIPFSQENIARLCEMSSAQMTAIFSLLVTNFGFLAEQEEKNLESGQSETE